MFAMRGETGGEEGDRRGRGKERGGRAEGGSVKVRGGDRGERNLYSFSPFRL